VIQWLNDNTSGLVFLLWGNYSQKKGSFVDEVQLIPFSVLVFTVDCSELATLQVQVLKTAIIQLQVH